jgi:hypothetical protein
MHQVKRERERISNLMLESIFILPGMIAHIYNPSYSGGKDQEGHGSKQTWANSL